MKETLLTRHDDNVGDGEFDSIAWAFSEHVKTSDDPKYNAEDWDDDTMTARVYAYEDGAGNVIAPNAKRTG